MSTRVQRKRRQTKQVIKFGRSAKPKHKRLHGRSGSGFKSLSPKKKVSGYTKTKDFTIPQSIILLEVKKYK